MCYTVKNCIEFQKMMWHLVYNSNAVFYLLKGSVIINARKIDTKCIGQRPNNKRAL